MFNAPLKQDIFLVNNFRAFRLIYLRSSDPGYTGASVIILHNGTKLFLPIFLTLRILCLRPFVHQIYELISQDFIMLTALKYLRAGMSLFVESADCPIDNLEYTYYLKD